MKRRKILVAEDDSALLRSIRLRLESRGYEVVTAQDGYQAVALALKEGPDLLLLDINMPAGDGFSVQDRVRKMEHLRRTPIIYITGDHSQTLVDRAVGVGARSILQKPFDTAELVQTVESILADSDSKEEMSCPTW